ncbi:phosphoribosyltransferase [Jeotgalibaca ciconiae]|uniref:Phosphoribosyl transferase n=1 Tax=Jeotgalibaca ciconiae TaxID=2496265 RepID=A0A3S9H9D1_9LACT|nr:phosphoribosyltransferase family protein [Jeotgalibaca ciconiae]AZP03968.1 phosphoribosyl transferase [Jeotgalibaca ciconiae]HJB23296.1 hypothetical protein [Candidatus Jeotgalibaca pullicola]
MKRAQFLDRHDAGRQLAEKLTAYQGENSIVFALPRGGVPLGVEVAKHLQVPLKLIITKKIGHPFNPEYAIGAISEHGKAIYNMSEIMQVDKEWLMNEEARLKNEIKRRRYKYNNKGFPESLEGKTAIIVDDGIATGYTMLAAIDDVKKQNPQKIVVAIPVVPESMAKKLEEEVHELITLERTRHYLGAVGAYYAKFNQLNDSDVIELLKNKYT